MKYLNNNLKLRISPVFEQNLEGWPTVWRRRQSLHAITGMFKITSLMNPLKATRVSFFRSSTAFGFGKSLVSISSVLKLKTNYLPHTSAQLHSVEEVLLIYERSKSFNPGFKDFDGGKNWEISVIFLKNYSMHIPMSALRRVSSTPFGFPFRLPVQFQNRGSSPFINYK